MRKIYLRPPLRKIKFPKDDRNRTAVIAVMEDRTINGFMHGHGGERCKSKNSHHTFEGYGIM